MNNPDKTGQKIDRLISEASVKLSIGIESSQKHAFAKVVNLIKGLDVDRNGAIKRTKKNLRLIRSINKEIGSSVVTDAYMTRVNQYLQTFTAIETAQRAYYSTITGFKQTDLHNLIKIESINNARNLLLNSGIDNNFSQPIKKILDRNVLAGANFTDMMEEVRGYILGSGGRDGRLLSYVKQVTSDSLHVYSGTYNTAIGSQLGLNFVKYTGSVKDTTRDFCSRRAGKFFHVSEVEKWAGLSWPGKASGTTASSIFQYAGGYNCRHLIIYVSDEIVPESVKKDYR